MAKVNGILTWFSRTVPPWARLHGVGELRVLKVSYLLIALIPVLQAGGFLWNSYAQRANQSALRAVNSLASDLLATVPQGDSNNQSHPRVLGELPPIASPGWDFEQLERALPRLIELTTSPPEVLAAQPEVQKRVEILATMAKDVVLRGQLPLYYLGWRVKVLFLSMVTISIANILYGIFCPETMRAARNSLPDSGRSGLGDQLDWCVRVFDLAYCDTKPVQKTDLVSRVLSPQWADLNRLEGNSEAEKVLANWVRIQHAWPSIRLACFLLYVIGMLISMFLLGEKVYDVFAH